MKSDKSHKLHLVVTARDLFGKKLKKMRHQGVVPANIFGPKYKSQSITVSLKDFINVYRVAHETGVVYLDLAKEEIPVLVRQIQHHPVTDILLHIDFRKIDLKQKIEASVPLKTINQSPAISQGGVLLTQADHVLVEALPEEMPSEIQIDLAKLVEIGTDVRVKDLPALSTYAVKDDPEKVLISIIAHKEESVTPETTVATPEVLTEKEGEISAEGAATEAAAPAGDDKKVVEAKPDSSKAPEKKEKAPEKKS